MATKTKVLLVIGGSDAGISAALRVKELKPEIEVNVFLEDEFPNLSICGLPYAISGDVADWHDLAHRKLAELTATGIHFFMNTTVDKINPGQHEILLHARKGETQICHYDFLLVATGAKPQLSGITGINQVDSRIHVMHTMADYFAIEKSLSSPDQHKAAIIGAGYIGIEMAEALRKRQLEVTLFQRSSEILATVDANLGHIVQEKLTENQVRVITNTAIKKIQSTAAGVSLTGQKATEIRHYDDFDLVLIVTGVQPNSQLLADAGAKIGTNYAVAVDEFMHTTLPDVWAAGDLVQTYHQLLGMTYLPLGTTAHKQGRVAGSVIAGYPRPFKGIVGTQVLKAFDLIVARTGLLDREAVEAGFSPLSVTSNVDDHKAYFPGAHKIKIRITGDRRTGQLLGAQLIGHFGSEVAKRNDVFATAIANKLTVSQISDLDLSYSPPVGSPWDAIQIAAQNWEKASLEQA
ncbi:FAD-dependent oxidoreductase [Oenococcus kitaharae]|uniref:NADH oxidase (Putative) n=1 Tax=Oenococcus kitaharae DSM 17330 TaxID=1045004 RepID=G9WFL6_9LACO|nr:FAD-dependent oxidoreductase [Oenococcus kitaharae]EHN59308.1 NADH oxidase (putative) [Oenococcus kitaharae DSM 17330]OEY82171.1 CoA-disulfide reductase [Oenococcus kitaharae]OEY82594.1 CoA-disulfide reductase [Oenococcus kitaharae]OEY84850.1 CoA-disulfide reductase [Oenococcus kitaharae]